jgi:large conductance mechanosensitive channel
MKGFIEFIRTRGVIGLAIGFLLGGAVSKLVSSLVNDIVNPIVGLFLGPAKNFTDLTIPLGSSPILIGQFMSNLLDFIIIAAIVYFIFKGLGLEKLDKKAKKE